MIGGLPDSTARAIGEMIVHTIEAMAAVSLVAAVLAVVCLVAGLRASSRRPVLYRVLGIVFIVVALIPPLILFVALNN